MTDQRVVSDAEKHAKSHAFRKMDSKYYKDDFVHTAIKELEYVRTPFYDLAHHEHLKEGQDTSKFLEEMRIKMEMIQPLTNML